jgi:putative NIF3 family GTP cyclohydrolase 1 type 2
LAEKQQLDAYITGEISEHDWHESQEAGIHMFAGGHNATEQFGIKALMEKTQQQFAVDCFFIGSENPA